MISIFIPTYNGEKYIAKTIESLLKQTYIDFEVICVDDSSTDSTISILKTYEKKDSRVRVLQKRHEGDVPHSWKYAIPLIHGEFTLYMSQDDLLAPDSLYKMFNRQKETNADAVLPMVVYYEEDKSIEEVRTYKGVDGDLQTIISGRDAFQLMLDYEISGFALWSTDIIKRVGIRTESYNSDELAQREWVANCNKVAFSDAVFYYRRDNENAITRTFTTRNLYRPLTDARLLELAIKLDLDSTLIFNHRNRYYQYLWWCASFFILHTDSYTRAEKKSLTTSFSVAYAIMHRGVALSKWYYKLSSKNILCFWVVLYIKKYVSIVKKHLT